MKPPLRLVLGILLSACGGAPSSPPAPPSELLVAPAASTGPARSARPDVIASTRFPADAPLEGNVAVAANAKLHPTAAAALAASKPTQPPTIANPALLSVYRVVAAPSGVVQVATGDVPDDCLSRLEARRGFGAGEGPSYAINAFVSREHLIARLADGMIVEHPDRTGARAERGAPLRVHEDGSAAFLDEALDRAIGTVPASRMTLATPRVDALRPEAAPRWKHELVPLACAPDPQPIDAWRTKQDAENRERRAREQTQESQRRYEACVEKERAVPKKNEVRDAILGGSLDLSCAAMQARGMFEGSSIAAMGLDLGMRGVAPEPPYCGIAAPEGQHLLASRMSGALFLSVETLAWSRRSSVGSGVKADTFLAEVRRSCGDVRVEVPREAVRAVGGAGGAGRLGTGRHEAPPLFPAQGSAVTWPDGTPAGTVLHPGPIPRAALTEARLDRMCTTVAPFAVPLCHARRDLCEAPGCPRTKRPPGREE